MSLYCIKQLETTFSSILWKNHYISPWSSFSHFRHCDLRGCWLWRASI